MLAKQNLVKVQVKGETRRQARGHTRINQSRENIGASQGHAQAGSRYKPKVKPGDQDAEAESRSRPGVKPGDQEARSSQAGSQRVYTDQEARSSTQGS